MVPASQCVDLVVDYGWLPCSLFVGGGGVLSPGTVAVACTARDVQLWHCVVSCKIEVQWMVWLLGWARLMLLGVSVVAGDGRVDSSPGRLARQQLALSMLAWCGSGSWSEAAHHGRDHGGWQGFASANSLWLR